MGSFKAEPLRKLLSEAAVRPRLALGRHDLPDHLDVVGAVGADDVVALEIGRRRQDDVGVARRVREERVVDDREEILAGEAAAHRHRVGTGDGRIIRGDEDRADRRVGQLEERLAEPRVVHDPRRGGARGLANEGAIQAEARRRHEKRAAAHAVVRPRHAWEQRDGADGLAAVHAAGHALAHADEGRPRAAVEVRETIQIGDGHARDRRHGGRVEARQDVALEPVEADRLARDVVAIAEAVAREDVHHAERQRRVRADVDSQVPVGALGGAAPPRLDHDELGAARAGLLDERPDVDVGREEIGAPGDDEVGLGHGLGIGPAHAAARRVPARLRARSRRRSRPRAA